MWSVVWMALTHKTCETAKIRGFWEMELWRKQIIWWKGTVSNGKVLKNTNEKKIMEKPNQMKISMAGTPWLLGTVAVWVVLEEKLVEEVVGASKNLVLVHAASEKYVKYYLSIKNRPTLKITWRFYVAFQQSPVDGCRRRLWQRICVKVFIQ